MILGRKVVVVRIIIIILLQRVAPEQRFSAKDEEIKSLSRLYEQGCRVKKEPTCGRLGWKEEEKLKNRPAARLRKSCASAIENEFRVHGHWMDG